MAASGCTERKSEARALASEMAAVASSHARSVCSEGGIDSSRATAPRAASSASVEARKSVSGVPGSEAAAVMPGVYAASSFSRKPS